MKKLFVVFIASCLFVILISAPISAQTKEEGLTLLNEALKLNKQAQKGSDIKKAAETFEQALKIFQKNEYLKGIAAASNNLGAIYQFWGQYEKAAENYEKSLAISRQLNDLSEESSSLLGLGYVYAVWGQYDKAINFYEKSLAISRQLNDPVGESNSLNNLGNVYRSRSQHEKALAYYEQSLAIARRLHDIEGESKCLNNLGNIYADWGQPEKAVDNYERSLALKRRLNDPVGESKCLNNLGNVYADWGQHGKAVDNYEQSLVIARNHNYVEGEAICLNNLGAIFNAQGQYDKAVEYHQQSLAIERRHNIPEGECNSLLSLGNVYADWGQYDKAANYYEQSLVIARSLNYQAGVSRCLNNLGFVYRSLGQYDKAANYYEQSLEIKRRLNDPAGEANSLNNLGNVYVDWGQYDKAVDYHDRALAINRRLNNPEGEAECLYSLGLVYRSWGQYSRALKEFQTALEKRRHLNDKDGEAVSLSSIGLTHAQLGQFDEALNYLEKANTIRTEIGISTLEGRDWIGNVYLDMDEVDKAEPFIVEAGYEMSLGRLSLAKRDYRKALDYYDKVRISAEKNRNSERLFAAYTGLGMAHENLGDDEAAVANYYKAFDFTEEVRSSVGRDQREKFFTVKVYGFLRTVPYDGLARVLQRMKRPLEAFKYSEYTKARVFVETLSRSPEKLSEVTRSDISPDALKKDRELNDELSALKKKRQEGYRKGDQQNIHVMEILVEEKERDIEIHKNMLRQKYPFFAATRYPEPMDLENIDLKPDEWVLAYHLTDPGIIIYLTRGKKIVKNVFIPIARNEIETLVSRFRKPLEMGPDDDLASKLASFDFVSGLELARLLLDDALHEIPESQRLIIVPDGCLGVLPFEMLVLNAGGKVQTEEINWTIHASISGAKFFGDRNPISYQQSLTALTLSRIYRQHRQSSDKILVIADPVYGSSGDCNKYDDRRCLPQSEPTGPLAEIYKSMYERMCWYRLDKTKNLAEKLERIHEGTTSSCTGCLANKEFFWKNIAPALDQYNHIIFATHGDFGRNSSGIREPMLILTLTPPGTDGYLRMSEVTGLSTRADIVALTACQTGLGERLLGEGTMGMGRAFQHAGAKSVLMSLWSVDEACSVDLVDSFFRHLKQGKDKLESLVLARATIRQAGFDHPFYWAPFILVGEVD